MCRSQILLILVSFKHIFLKIVELVSSQNSETALTVMENFPCMLLILPFGWLMHVYMYMYTCTCTVQFSCLGCLFHFFMIDRTGVL